MKETLDEIFKAYDIRGKVGSELNNEVVEKIGRAFGQFLPEAGTVAVGYDMRPDSRALSEALIAGLRGEGRTVWDIGQVTSDMIYFAVGKHELAGGAVVTASHNPGEYNGIKLCREQARAVGVESGLLDIKQRVLELDETSTDQLGELEQVDVMEDWMTHVLSFVDTEKLAELHIAVDAGNGMAGKTFAELEPYVPFVVEELYFELDGSFPNHIANPLEPKNLVDLQQLMKKQGCQAGVAFDGDGDRAVLLDEYGEPLSGTVMTALLADYFLDLEPKATILYNAICGRVVPELVEKRGGTAIRTKVGHSYIKGTMRERDAIFAGEHSGHYYFRDNFYADSGLIAAIIVLAIMSTKKQPLSKLAAPYRQAYAGLTETNYEVADKPAMIDKVAAEFADGEQDQLDGLTVNYPYGWINVRPSNTEPLLRFNAEAKSQKQLDGLVARAEQVLANA